MRIFLTYLLLSRCYYIYTIVPCQYSLENLTLEAVGGENDRQEKRDLSSGTAAAQTRPRFCSHQKLHSFVSLDKCYKMRGG